MGSKRQATHTFVLPWGARGSPAQTRTPGISVATGERQSNQSPVWIRGATDMPTRSLAAVGWPGLIRMRTGKR